jgi:hypothetical protein
MREDARLLRHHGGAECAHRPAARHIFVVDRVGFVIQPILDLVDRLARFGAG